MLSLQHLFCTKLKTANILSYIQYMAIKTMLCLLGQIAKHCLKHIPHFGNQQLSYGPRALSLLLFVHSDM